ncbi:MAG TPA: DNA polymerase III subunit gamma/tau [Verrucomicrobiae bacterium]|nr:DNA polymerase III subunit gamma/tau [Verrucomicrobiae bacterium]
MSYQVIARKWRPQKFSDLVGQEHVTETLGNAIKNDRVAHAYIFSGARGVGKTTAARILAKALNCVHGPTATPCGECDSCREIAAGTSLDVIEIDAASNRGIDQIRELREMVRYAPASSRSKVVILDEAHMLTGEASNALLKTLEEPPDRVIFVMATTQPEDLVDTIRSRSQHFHFRALTFGEITARLEEIAQKENLKIDAGALAVISRMAEGSMRDALSLLEQARAYCGEVITDAAVRELLGVVPDDALATLVSAIAEGSADRALGLIHTFQKEGRNLQHFCREAIRHMRNLLIAKVCGADSDLIAATADQRPALAKAASLFSEEDLTRFFQILLQTDDDLRRKPDPRVHLEMGLLRLINAARLAPLEELLTEIKSGTGGVGGGPVPVRRAASASATSAGTGGTSAVQTSSAIPVKTLMNVPPPVTYKDDENRPGIAAASNGAAMNDSAVTGARDLSMPTGAAFGNSNASTFDSAAATKSEPFAPRPNGAFSFQEREAEKVLSSENGGTAATPNQHTENDLQYEGITAEQVAQIKAAVQQQQKFLGELLEHATIWELAGVELKLYFPAGKKSFAEMLEGRDSLEKLRGISSNVLGRALRVCAKLAASTSPEAATRAGSEQQELRAKFERDPMVRSILQRFGGKISEVRRAQGE